MLLKKDEEAMARYPGKKTRFYKGGITRARNHDARENRDVNAAKKLQAVLRVLSVPLREMFRKDQNHHGTFAFDKRSEAKFSISNNRHRGLGKYSADDIIDRAIETVGSLFQKIRKSRAAIFGILAGIMMAFMILIIFDFIKVQSLANFHPNITTKIYDKNGVLISELFVQKREIVPFKKIPRDLINAFIAIEDNEFYDHWGINPKGIVRAFFINLFSGRIRQGGSTITQQLAKILLTSGERSIFRKIEEAFIAVLMEATYSKDKILSLYLNQIYLGHGTYGVESAARYYFNKHVWELNLAESSLLASLPSAPNQYSPIRHTKRSMQHHKVVLAKMVEMGFVTVEQAEQAYLDFWNYYKDYVNELSPTMNTMSSRTNKAPWVTEYVRRELVKKYGNEMVYEKGLLVYTTIDLKKQLSAQEVLKENLEKQTEISGNLSFKNVDYIVDKCADTVQLFSTLFGMPSFTKKGSRRKERINDYFRNELAEELDGLNSLVGIDSLSKFLDQYKTSFKYDPNFQKVEGCLVSIDQRTGYIEAMVGGSEFTSINQLNRVKQARRQPGSAIKPLIYAAAIESGKFTAATTVLDSPVVFLDSEGGDWIPENYEGDYSGFVRLRKALALSINVVSIRIAEKLGIGYVTRELAKLLKFGDSEARERIARNFSIALGSTEVSPLELATAYAIIANGGRDVIPFLIRSVKDRQGHELENKEEEVRKRLSEEEEKGTTQIIKPETSQVMISMLQSVITSGTGSAASPGRPAGGKTGTTNNWKDAWFVGFTPQLTTGIWIGYDKLGLSLGIGQAGGAVAAPIWGEYMREALKDEPVMDFPHYAGLVSQKVCAKSGLLPSSNCRETLEEYFVPGTVPEKTCDVCTGDSWVDFAKKSPRQNIFKEQTKAIKKQMRKKKKESIIDHIDDDLLE
jgi:penicillin-binding protein 1A